MTKFYNPSLCCNDCQTQLCKPNSVWKVAYGHGQKGYRGEKGKGRLVRLAL